MSDIPANADAVQFLLRVEDDSLTDQGIMAGNWVVVQQMPPPPDGPDDLIAIRDDDSGAAIVITYGQADPDTLILGVVVAVLKQAPDEWEG